MDLPWLKRQERFIAVRAEATKPCDLAWPSPRGPCHLRLGFLAPRLSACPFNGCGRGFVLLAVGLVPSVFAVVATELPCVRGYTVLARNAGTTAPGAVKRLTDRSTVQQPLKRPALLRVLVCLAVLLAAEPLVS